MIILIVFAAVLGCSTAMYPTSSDVVDLTPTNFDRLVTQSDEIWIVEFYAPWCGHCQQLVPEYQKAAKALKGLIKVGAVNCDEHKTLGGQYGVKGFPTIKIFASNKKSPQDFNGQRTATGIADAGLAEAKKKVQESLGGSSSNSGSGSDDVIELTDSNFERLVYGGDVWLVEFFAPWCGHCKSLEPHWSKAATALKGKVKMGAVDATVHTRIASEFGVRGYPTIKFFAAGSQRPSDATEYNAGRTSQDIINWATERYADSIPAPDIYELTGETIMTETCDGKPLCILSVLPHILDCDAKCRNGYLSLLRKMGEKYKQKQWGWLWTEGSAQTDLEEALEIGGFGYPAMAVVNFKKMKYSLLKGSFSNEGINDFLRDISFGRGHTAPVRGAKVPKIRTTDAWDGKDGQLPEEDDIDLSDIILDEKDEL